MATGQVTGTYGTGIGPVYTYVNKKLLEIAKPYMPLHTLAQKKLIPLNSGTIGKFTRLMRLPKVTSALTEGTADTPGNVYATDFDVTVAEWGDSIAVSSLLDMTFITPALTAYTEILAISAGQSMNLELQKTLWGTAFSSAALSVHGCIGLAGERTTPGSFNQDLTANSTASTTTFGYNELFSGNLEATEGDDFKGGTITFNNPQSPNYGFARRISDSSSTSPVTITWLGAVKVAHNDANTLLYGAETARVTHFKTTGALKMTKGTDVLRAKTIRRAYSVLDSECAVPFVKGDYAIVIPPHSMSTLSEETSTGGFLDTFKYTDSGPILDNEIARTAGFRVLKETEPYLIDATAATVGNYTGTKGDMEVVFALGKNCLGACGLQGNNSIGQADTKIIVKRPGPGTTSDPTDMFSTMAWKTTWARLSLNACWGVGIVVYPNTI